MTDFDKAAELAEPDPAEQQIRVLDLRLVAEALQDLNLSYGLAETENFLVPYRDFALTLSVEQMADNSPVLAARLIWRSNIPNHAAARVRAMINEYHSRFIIPQIEMRIGDDGWINMYAGYAVPARCGWTRRQLASILAFTLRGFDLVHEHFFRSHRETRFEQQ